MENVVNADHSTAKRVYVTHVAYVELDFVCNFGHLSLKFMTHVILLFLVTGKNTDFLYICFKKAIEYGIAE